MQSKIRLKIDLNDILQVAIVSLLFVWKIIPQLYYLNRGAIMAIAYQIFFVAWILLTIIKSGVWFKNIKVSMFLIVAFLLYILVEGVIFPNVQPGYLALLMSFWEMEILYFYYSRVHKNRKLCTILVIVAVAAMLVGTFQSIRAVSINSLAVRLSSSSQFSDTSLLAGNYTFTAMLTIILPVMLLMAFSNVHNVIKIFCAVFTIASIYFIIRCNLLISTLCMILGIAMIVFVSKEDKLTRNRFFWSFVLIIVVFAVFSSTKVQFLIIDTIESLIDSKVVTKRLDELKTFISQGALTGDFRGRINLSMIAIKTFLHNPIFGIGPQNDWDIYFKTQLGLHATLWDDFARYGLVGMYLYFRALHLTFRQNSTEYLGRAKKAYRIGVAEYFIISMLNPTISVNVAIALFFVLPECCYYMSLKDNNRMSKPPLLNNIADQA